MQGLDWDLLRTFSVIAGEASLTRAGALRLDSLGARRRGYSSDARMPVVQSRRLVPEHWVNRPTKHLKPTRKCRCPSTVSASANLEAALAARIRDAVQAAVLARPL